MPGQLIIYDEVVLDLADAITWYDDQQTGLGQRVQTAFYDAIQAVALNPKMLTPDLLDFRHVLLDPFPLAAYYRIQGENVVFVRVFHTARNPKTVRRELRRIRLAHE